MTTDDLSNLQVSEQHPAAHQLTFSGGTIELVRHDGHWWVPLRAACRALGLDFSSQRLRLQKAVWATVVILNTVALDGKPRDIYCLRADRLAMWLATLAPGHVEDLALRKKIEVWQCEAADALDRWARGQRGVNSRDSSHEGEDESSHGRRAGYDIDALIRRELESAVRDEVRKQVRAQVRSTIRKTGGIFEAAIPAIRTEKRDAATGEFLRGWLALCGELGVRELTAADAIAYLLEELELIKIDGRRVSNHQPLIDAMCRLSPSDDGLLPAPGPFGYVLRKLKLRVIEGLRLESSPTGTNNLTAWSVTQAAN